MRDVYIQIYPRKRRKRERGNVFLNKAHQALLDTVHMLAKNLKTHNSKNTRTHTRNLKGVYTHIRGGREVGVLYTVYTTYAMCMYLAGPPSESVCVVGSK